MKKRNTIYEVVEHALAMRGAQLQFGGELSEDNFLYAVVTIPGASWTEFFEVVYENGEAFGVLPVFHDRLITHQLKYPNITPTNWLERNGHVKMRVPIDGSVSVEELKKLIDEAYEIVWNKLDHDARYMIELALLPYDELTFIKKLTSHHKLEEYQGDIHALIRSAILLRTKAEQDAGISLGATKIGGQPDLPQGTSWPTYTDGRPLAFLLQIDLATIPNLGSVINGLPSKGLISLFSAWGWATEEGGAPQVPNSDFDEQTGWTVILYSSDGDSLRRHAAPDRLNVFPSAVVQPTPILSLPNSQLEPPVAMLNWTDEVYEQFDVLQYNFRQLQMAHWFKDANAFASHHLLGGYALFQQQYPEELLHQNLKMLFQIGTDPNAEMHWDDGGELTFYADIDVLNPSHFDRIWGTCQGG